MFIGEKLCIGNVVVVPDNHVDGYNLRDPCNESLRSDETYCNNLLVVIQNVSEQHNRIGLLSFDFSENEFRQLINVHDI